MSYQNEVYHDLEAFIHNPNTHQFYCRLRKEVIELAPFSNLAELTAFFKKSNAQFFSEKGVIIHILTSRYQRTKEREIYKILLLLLFPGLSHQASRLEGDFSNPLRRDRFRGRTDMQGPESPGRSRLGNGQNPGQSVFPGSSADFGSIAEQWQPGS